MQISEQELRTLVREAVARHSGQAAGPRALSPAAMVDAAHSSHGRFLRLSPTDDGQCVIEPAVRCNHCGYCQSYGH